MSKNNYKKSLQKAVKLAGTQQKLVELCGNKFTKYALQQWLYQSTKIPCHHAFSIDTATKGAIKIEDLRPDIYVCYNETIEKRTKK